MYELSLFSGAGGGLLATKWLLGWQTVCYVEKEAYAVEIIKARIRDGFLDNAPIWDDVRTFDGRPWCGCVDIITAGFPCQPFAKGGKRRGASDERNEWPNTIRIIREVKPEWVFLENSPNLLSPFRKRGLPAYIDTVLRDLATEGYVGQWGCLSASTLGADHKRSRVWIFAYSGCRGRKVFLRSYKKGNSAENEPQTIKTKTTSLDALWSRLSRLEKSLGEPSVFGIDDGLAHRVDRLRAIGEGQVPAVAAKAWEMFIDRFRNGNDR